MQVILSHLTNTISGYYGTTLIKLAATQYTRLIPQL
jgi:hypothetical protein